MMRQLRFIFIALTTFLFVTSTAFLRRTVSILLCGVLSFNSASCYNFLDKYGKVDAVTPLSSTFALSNPSSSYAYIVRKQELTTPEGCKVVLNTKNIDGKPFPDYFQFIAEDKKTCGNSFTSRVNPNANGVTVSVNTDEGPVIYTIQSVPSEQGSPNQGVKITTNYPDGKTEIYTGESPDNGERYRINYENNSGKNETYTFDVPNDLKPSFANNEQTKPTEKPESEFCRFANEYCHSFEDVSKAFTKFEIAFLSFGILKGLPSRLKSLLPYLNPLDKGLSLLQLPCFLIVGGFPELPYKEIFKKLGVEFGNTVNQPYNEVVGLLYKDRTQEELDKVIDDIRKGTWAEAPCKRLAQAHSTNDPHLVTFDGLKYDLQTVGEFTLIKSNNSDFEVQARQTPYNNSASLSINSAVAMKVGSDRVALYAQGFPDADTTTPLRVNGKPTTTQDDKVALKGGGEILKQGSTYVISVPTGEKVLVSLSSSFLNISPIVHNRSGKYSGLLGNVNGNPNDDQQTRGGGNVLKVQSTYGDVNKVLNQVGLRLPGALDKAEKVYFDQLYKEFANSWRVKQEESLFDYPAGKTTESYLNPSFPDQYLKLDMLSPEQIEKAQNACTEAKVTGDLMKDCIFDVGFSGFSEFARTTAQITGYVNILNQLSPSLNIPTPEQAVDRVIQQVKPKICLPFIGCH